nr:MAG TPA: hypothetical protein [Caudoviricetes sp.]
MHGWAKNIALSNQGKTIFKTIEINRITGARRHQVYIIK